MTLPEDLKCKTIQLVDCSDLDSFIEKHLGKKWSSLHNEDECFNGSYTTFPVGEYWNEPGQPTEAEKVQEWLTRPSPERYHRIGDYNDEGKISTLMLLNELWRRGILPEGDLSVHMWW